MMHRNNITFNEKNINGSRVSIGVEIQNDIRNLVPKVHFYGSYDGTYEYTEVLDYQRFMVELNVEGIKRNNLRFYKYRDSLGKLLDCLVHLEKNQIIDAFEDAYSGLDLLIKEVKNIKSITPVEIKEYLIEIGFDEDKAEKIRILRNRKIIHLTQYGFWDQDPNIEEKLKKCLKDVVKAYFKVFDNEE